MNIHCTVVMQVIMQVLTPLALSMRNARPSKWAGVAASEALMAPTIELDALDAPKEQGHTGQAGTGGTRQPGQLGPRNVTEPETLRHFREPVSETQPQCAHKLTTRRAQRQRADQPEKCAPQRLAPSRLTCAARPCSKAPCQLGTFSCLAGLGVRVQSREMEEVLEVARSLATGAPATEEALV